MLAGPPKRLASDCPEVICQGSQLLGESKASFQRPVLSYASVQCFGAAVCVCPVGGQAASKVPGGVGKWCLARED